MLHVDTRFTINVKDQEMKTDVISSTRAVVPKCVRRLRLGEIIRPLFTGDTNAPTPRRPKIVNIAQSFPLKILLAEDNEVNIKVETQLLSKLGYTIDVVHNGAGAVEQSATTRYDLILMDVYMPVMDGLEATRRICEAYPDKTKRPYICAMTANAMSGDMERCMEAGCDGYLSKPIHVDRLTEILYQCKEGRE
jgi:CheY-like chemotaxis protein